MSDFEDQLRAAVGRHSAAYEPSAGLPDRIDARVRRHRRRRQVLTGGVVSAAAAAVAIAALVTVDRDDGDRIRTTDEDADVITRPPATSTVPTPSTSSTTSTSTPTSIPGTGGGVGDISSPTREGIGPITAGMTLRQAQEAAGTTLTAAPVGGGSCLEAPLGPVDGGTVLVVEAVGADPLDGVVRAVAGSVLPSTEGAMVGQSRAELIASLGQPTRVEPGPPEWGPAAELLVFQEGDHAYGALVVDDLVLGLQSGDPAWITNPNGCPD